MTDIEITDIPSPPFAVSIGDWDVYDHPPTRVIVGHERQLDGTRMSICVATVQDINGQIDLGVGRPHILLGDDAFDADQIRAFAAVFVDIAEELDRWIAWAEAAQCHADRPCDIPPLSRMAEGARSD